MKRRAFIDRTVFQRALPVSTPIIKWANEARQQRTVRRNTIPSSTRCLIVTNR